MMKKRYLRAAWFVMCALLQVNGEVHAAEARARVIKHVIVYHEPGRFGGWPANHGAWSWGNELLVGFDIGDFQRKDTGHAINYRRMVTHALGRSLDGGETWTIETPESLQPPPGFRTTPRAIVGKRELTDCPGNVDFSRHDFILTVRWTTEDGGQSRFYYSYDRGKTWEGPFRIPNFGQPGTAARTDYLINGKHDLIIFLTADKANGREGRVMCARTQDGAKSWKMLSFIGPEPEGDEYTIMPSSVRLPDGRITTAIRDSRGTIDLYESADDGKSWRYMSRAASGIGDNPPSMVLLRDGRLVVTYGYRTKPYGMRARISGDEGKTWGDEIVLRADGGNEDLGYPRTLVRPDGNLVTIYYFNVDKDAERFIGATIWNPGKK